MKTMKSKLDFIGVVLSTGCAIHCLLLPLILPALPMLGFVFDHESNFHLILSVVISFVAVAALSVGYYKHKMIGPMISASIGLFLIITMGIIERHVESPMIVILTVVGSMFILTGHYFNHKYTCACPHHNKNHSCH